MKAERFILRSLFFMVAVAILRGIGWMALHDPMQPNRDAPDNRDQGIPGVLTVVALRPR